MMNLGNLKGKQLMKGCTIMSDDICEVQSPVYMTQKEIREKYWEKQVSLI
jgi:hypothetical protein